MGDERVRDTHDPLYGIVVGLDDYFVTYDGDKALFAGGFSKAENNVNCRCLVEYTTVREDFNRTTETTDQTENY